MRPLHRLLPSILGPLVLAGLLVPTSALAQTITANGQTYPTRLVGTQNLGVSTRPANVNPYGVNASDCQSDMTLQFSVELAGFAGETNLEVWASTTGDCTAATDRGIGAAHALCWHLNDDITDPIINTPAAYTFKVRVQDLIGPQSETLPVAGTYTAQGADACTHQPTPAAVPINVNFLAIDASGNSQGTPFSYSIMTDVVGPPAPVDVVASLTGPDLLATWTPNTDSDTAGYDVFISWQNDADGGTSCAPPPTGAVAPTGVDGGSEGMTVSGRSAGQYQLKGFVDSEAAVSVVSVDASGNLGPASTPDCLAVGALSDNGTAGGGVSCAVASPGAASAAVPLFGVLVLGASLAKRRAR